MAEQNKKKAAKKPLPADPKERFKAQANIRLPKAVAALDAIGAMATRENSMTEKQVDFVKTLLTKHLDDALDKLTVRATGGTVVAGVPTIAMPD